MKEDMETETHHCVRFSNCIIEVKTGSENKQGDIQICDLSLEDLLSHTDKNQRK